MQPHNLAHQPSSLLTHSPVLQQHLFWAFIDIPIMYLSLSKFPSQPPVLVRMCINVCVLLVRKKNRERRSKHVYSFPLGSFKNEFYLQSNLQLIYQDWLPAYIILHSCSAHMAQRDLSLFYYRSDNLGLLSLVLVIACPWVFYYGGSFHSSRYTTNVLLRAGGKGECYIIINAVY